MEPNELRKIAEAATPGPWETLGGQGPFGTHAVCHRMEQGTLVEIAYRDAHFDKANAVHIATFDPPAVLTLLSRLEQAEQDRVKLRNRLDAMRRQRDGYRKQLRKTEQQIQRVREVATNDPTEYGWSEAMLAVLRALDGDTHRCAECNGTGDVQVRFAHGVQAQDCASCFGSGEPNE